MAKKKVLIFIICYQSSYRLLKLYNKIPFKKLKKYDCQILISDDFSSDDTIKFAKKIKKINKFVKIVINKNNLGYGKHIKKCLIYAIKNKFDYAVMIHGDGQFNPKYIPKLLLKLTSNKIAASTGSRLYNGIKSVIKGGMPFYKLIGNILLTKFFNFLMNTKFTDAHTGLWAYNLRFIGIKELNSLTNTFNFDQEFRFKNVIENNYIEEIFIQTKYGDERSQLHIKYAFIFFLNCIKFYFIKKIK